MRFLKISIGYIPTSCENLATHVFAIGLTFSRGVIETGILNGDLIKIIDDWVLQIKK
jgi:hypothetical protein